MHTFKVILKSLTVAFIATAVLTVATVIRLMFTEGKEIGRHVGLFGSVFFEARETDMGSIEVGLGLQNPWVVTLIFLAIFLFSVLVFIILSGLQSRKKMLEQRVSNAKE